MCMCEIEREQRANHRCAAPTREIRQDEKMKEEEEEIGGGGGGSGRLDLITPRTSWLTMQPRESGEPKSRSKRRRLENTTVYRSRSLNRERKRTSFYKTKRCTNINVKRFEQFDAFT